MDIETLKKKRASTKRSITVIEKFVLDRENTPVDANNVQEYHVRERQLDQVFQKYTQIQDEIEIVDDSQFADRAEIEDKFYSLSAKLKSQITLFSQTSAQQQNSSSASQSSNLNAPHSLFSQIKLPSLEIPTFSGKYEEFPAFKDLFSALIDKNDSLSDVQKLMYLKSVLKDEPLDLINNLTVTNENYAVAKNLIDSRFDKKLLIINAHLRGLLEVPQLTTGNASLLRRFLTQINKHLKAIAALGVQTDNWDLLLIYTYSKHLDFNTRRCFESERDDRTLPTLNEFLDFLDKRCSTLETLSSSNNQYKSQRESHKLHREINDSQRAMQRIPQITYVANDNSVCLYCKIKNHTIYKCTAFSKIPVDQKRQFVLHNGLCLNCLGSRHRANDCTSSRCRVCGLKHHTLLHDELTSKNPNHLRPNSTFQYNAPRLVAPRGNESVQASGSSDSQRNESANPAQVAEQITTCMTAHNSVHSQILLATAKIILTAENGNSIQARALLDSASQTSFITNDIFKQLSCPSQKRYMPITGIGHTKTQVTRRVKLKVNSRIERDYSVEGTFAILDKITCHLPQVPVDKAKFMTSAISRLDLADDEFYTPAPVDVLIGADLYFDIMEPGLMRLGNHLPTLVQTHLGWIVAGPAPVKDPFSPLSFLSVSLCSNSPSLDELLPRFWQLEEIHNKHRFLSPEDKLCESIFSATTKRLADGTFQVDIPFKTESSTALLGNSLSQARQRFQSLEKRLSRDNELASRYKAFIDEYVTLGHGKYVPLNCSVNNPVQRYFLPHHCIIRESKLTTKLRIVFDGGMQSSTGLSLNDVMLKGPTVQPDLFDIVCRFRIFEFVFTADIEKMYRQIRINPSQAPLQTILWRDNPSEDLKCIELQTVTYGTKAAPYLATRCLNQLAQDNSALFPLGSGALLTQCYVDDILSGSNSRDQLLKLRSELVELLKSAGFRLHKWCFNNASLFSSIDKDVSCQEIVFKDSSNKVLGLIWDPVKDVFKLLGPPQLEFQTITKRQALSHLAQIFDPLGLVSPIVIVGKVLIQKLWSRKLNWDDELPPDLVRSWKSFSSGLLDLSNISIPRWLHTSSDHLSIELHGFSDATPAAYGAVLYMRTVYPNQTVSTNIICSKSKVAPLKSLSLPRLELCGAHLLARLAHKVVDVFPYKFGKIVLWTDSQIVLCWLRDSPSRWNTFVANRTSEIQELTSAARWCHIDSQRNPADLISRGSDCSSLITNELWWHGPQFLSDYHCDFGNVDHIPELDDIPDQRNAVAHLHTRSDFCLEFQRFSKFARLQRTFAYVLRFVNNCKNYKPKLSGPLSVEELQGSLTALIRCIQTEHFSEEIAQLESGQPLKNASIQSLCPFLDDQRLLRVGGRLHNAPVPYEQKHPLLLPPKIHFVNLLIQHEHLRLGHAGAQTVLANLRQRFWPINALGQIKKVIHQCITCFRFRLVKTEQVMGTLPPERVSIARAFLNVAVDFGGPIIVKESRLRKSIPHKAYFALFICMNTKAVHLELVSDLSTDAFLLTLKRFVARRGNPATIFSDNATNFRGANNVLHDVYKFFKSDQNLACINDYLSASEIKWKFIPPNSPHWGGLWEAGIKSTKFHLRRLLGRAVLTFEQVLTILAQIEGVLNSRPLCPLSSDPSDLSCLTPGHFIIGQPLTSFPEKDLTSVPENRLSFLQQVSAIKQIFWKRFSIEYFNRLQHRPKWIKPYTNLKENTLVLVKEDNSPPLHWVLGRIQRVMPSADGRVRVVEVKTRGGLFVRPITKLAPLPLV